MTHHPIPEQSSRHTTGRKRRGINGENQKPILDLLAHWKHYGCTCGEIETALARGHGQVSGALSTLHQHGKVEMLKLRRGRQHVYVLAEFADKRECEPRRNVTAHDVIYASVDCFECGNQDEAERLLLAYVKACEERKAKK